MEKYVCQVCGYVYDPAAGDPDNGVNPGNIVCRCSSGLGLSCVWGRQGLFFARIEGFSHIGSSRRRPNVLRIDKQSFISFQEVVSAVLFRRAGNANNFWRKNCEQLLR